MQQTAVDDVLVEDKTFRKVTFHIWQENLDGMKRCANRDSRDLGHVMNVALDAYIKSRKL